MQLIQGRHQALPLEGLLEVLLLLVGQHQELLVVLLRRVQCLVLLLLLPLVLLLVHRVLVLHLGELLHLQLDQQLEGSAQDQRQQHLGVLLVLVEQ